MEWELPEHYASDQMATSIENFIADRAQAARTLSDAVNGLARPSPLPVQSFVCPSSRDGDIEIEADTSVDSVEALKTEVIRKLHFNREELLRKHFGVAKPDEEMLRDILEHFRAREESARVTAVAHHAPAKAVSRVMRPPRMSEFGPRPLLTVESNARKSAKLPLHDSTLSWKKKAMADRNVTGAAELSRPKGGVRAMLARNPRESARPSTSKPLLAPREQTAPQLQRRVEELSREVQRLSAEMRALAAENAEMRRAQRQLMQLAGLPLPSEVLNKENVSLRA